MPVPVFCFDVDGTLLDRQGAIHANDVAILRGQFGARLVPATGRPLGSLKRAFSRHGLFQGAQLPFPLILQNGAVIYTEMGQDPAYFPFDRQLQAELVDLLLALPRVTFFLLGMDEVQVVLTSEDTTA